MILISVIYFKPAVDWLIIVYVQWVVLQLYLGPEQVQHCLCPASSTSAIFRTRTSSAICKQLYRNEGGIGLMTLIFGGTELIPVNIAICNII